MGKVILGVVVAGVALVVGCGYWLNYSLDHRGLSSVDEHAAEKMAASTKLPVLWLGPAYDSNGDGSADLELTTFRVRDSSQMYVGYGRCRFPPREGGCGLPLSMVFDPPCQFIGDPPRIGDVRGVETRDAGDSIYLLTRDYAIRIWAPHAPDGAIAAAIRVAESLYGANKLAAGITTTTDLPPRPAGLCNDE